MAKKSTTLTDWPRLQHGQLQVCYGLTPALASFNLSTATFQLEDSPTFDKVLKELTEHVFPTKAAQTQKCTCICYLRKPVWMTPKEFTTRVVEINEPFPYFPQHPGTHKDIENFEDDKLLEILEFTCPYNWKREMILRNFDPVTSSLKEFVSFVKGLSVRSHT